MGFTALKTRGMNRSIRQCLGLCLLFAAATPVLGEKPQAQNLYQAQKFKLPYMEGNVLKAIFYGDNARPVLGGKDLILTDQFRLETFANGDQTKLESIIQGPRCILNRANHNASSDGPITIITVSPRGRDLLTTNLMVSGMGFSTLETNSILVVSNATRTVVFNKEKNSPNRDIYFGPWLPDTTPPLVVASDFLKYFLQGKLAEFRGNVRAEQNPFGLACARMDVQMGPNNSPTNIIADEEVVITDQREQGQATGTRAVYDAQAGLMRLTGQPHWKDALGREGWAREFIYDRNAGVIRGVGEARTLLPGKEIGGENLALSGPAGPSSKSTNSVFDIRAATIQFDAGGRDALAGAKDARTSRHFEAHEHVVMTNQVEQTWATGDDAVFTQDTGQLRLSGNAVWILREDRVEGDVIEANRNTRALEARPNAVVTVPSRAFQSGGKPAGKNPKTPEPGQSTVQIHADDFFWQTNVATFTGKVHAVQTEQREVSAVVDCRYLQMTFDQTNHIRAMSAQGKVRGEEFAIKTRPSTGHLSCERLDLTWYPGGQLLRRVEAEDDVHADQTVLNPAPKPVVYRRAQAAMLWLSFSSVTNQVESALAKTNVFILELESDHGPAAALLPKVERGARGARADYLAAPRGKGLVMTGNTLAWLVRTNAVKMTNSIYVITNASSLTWSPTSGRFNGAGPYEILSATNKPAY